MEAPSVGNPDHGILVVEDHPPTLQALVSMLSAAGYHVRTATDGEWALRSARVQPPDLILLDVRLPDLDGFEVCRRLKADDRTQSVPVIFTTWLDEPQSRVLGFQLGAVDYITKPFDNQEVLARVGTHLTLRRAQLALVEANQRLKAEIAERQRAEIALRELNESLEQRIGNRTAEIEQTNCELRCEIETRQQVEAALRASETRYRALAEQNAHLLEQSQADAETKAVLLHEVNHRVKNNLAAIVGLLQLELRHQGLEAQIPYRSLVEDLTSRIQSLALVHNLLSASLWAPLPLDKLAEHVMQIGPVMLSRQHLVQLDIAPTSVRLNSKQASAVGLILNELTTNSLKHALRPDEPIQLSVRFAQTEARICLEYRDNGPGYPEAVLQGKRDCVGLYLIEALAQHDLDGTITVANEAGAVTRLTFSLASGAEPDNLPAATAASVATSSETLANDAC